MSLSAGTQLGPYEILEPIGAGGMGAVYKARDTRLDRVVAIKVAAEKFSERFAREAHAIAALNHPHICTLFDVGPDYLVMEYIEGRPLQGPVAAAEAIRAGIQIAEALEHAHAHGVVHRDLKPGNILATKTGVKVLDFGLAKLTAAEAGLTLTVAGGVMGTPLYMAPEQRVGKPADARTDIYALGLILHELLTGGLPDGQPDLAACGAVAPVVRICLAKDADDRWQSARDVRHALEMLEQAAPATPRETAGGVWKWTAMALGAVAMLTAAFALWPRPGEEKENLRFEINPPPGMQFVDGSRISPDGRQVALMVDEGDTVSIWNRPLNSLEMRKLQGTEGAQGLCWSPDSRSLAFAVASSLKRIDFATSQSYTIGEGRFAALRLQMSWGADGTILYDASQTGPLKRMSASGGTSSPATELRTAMGAFANTWPQFLPDGRHFLYLERTPSRQTQGIYLASLDRPGDVVQILRISSGARFAPFGSSSYLLWVRGGALVGQRLAANLLQLEGDVKTLVQPASEDYSVSNNGILVYRGGPPPENRLVWLDRTGKTQAEVTHAVTAAASAGAARLSPDNSRLVFNRLDESNLQDLWQVELGRGTARRLTFGAQQGGGGWGVWSPDGSELVLNIVVSGTRRLARLSSSGGSSPKLITDNSIPSIGQFAHDWSPDGRFLAFVNLDTSADIWILPFAPGEKPWPLLATPFAEDQPQFSPDGHWLAYTSDESGRVEVYIQGFPKLGDKVTVSSNGGSQPRWRRDGKELFFVTLDGTLMAAAVKPGASALEVGEPRPLFRMPLRQSPNQYTYDVAKDGQRFLAIAPTEQARPEPLKVMLNWKAALK